MRIVILYNPISGRGGAQVAAKAVRGQLVERGHDVTLGATKPPPAEPWLPPLVTDAELIVVLGGDGAVRLCAPVAAQQEIPIYHLPYGTENLFAREWGMDASVDRLCRAIDAGDIVRADIGSANGEPFLLMVSIGFDAEVVADLARHRAGAITHFSYAGPIIRQFLQWRAPRLGIVLDGRTLVDDEPGFIVIGNARQYGGRFDPALNADMCDGMLDVVFFPTRSRFQLLRWALAIRMRRHLRNPRLVYERGRAVQISSATPVRYQVDGDQPESTVNSDAERRVSSLDVKLRAGAVQVLATRSSICAEG